MFRRIVRDSRDRICVGRPKSQEATRGGRPVGELEPSTIDAINAEHVGFLLEKPGEGELHFEFGLGSGHVLRIDERGPVRFDVARIAVDRHFGACDEAAGSGVRVARPADGFIEAGDRPFRERRHEIANEHAVFPDFAGIQPDGREVGRRIGIVDVVAEQVEGMVRVRRGKRSVRQVPLVRWHPVQREHTAVADDGVRRVGVVGVEGRFSVETVAEPDGAVPGRADRILETDVAVVETLAEDVLAVGSGGERDEPVRHLDADVLVGRREARVDPLRPGGLNVFDEFGLPGQRRRASG